MLESGEVEPFRRLAPPLDTASGRSDTVGASPGDRVLIRGGKRTVGRPSSRGRSALDATGDGADSTVFAGEVESCSNPFGNNALTTSSPLFP